MDYCEINRQLEYLIIIVETVTTAMLARADTGPSAIHSLFPVFMTKVWAGHGILLSGLPPAIPLLMFVARGREEGGVAHLQHLRTSPGAPTCGSPRPGSHNTLPATPALPAAACSLGGKISW